MNRCIICKRKIQIDVQCKCGNSFCMEHLPFFKHGCKFNYRENKSKKLKESLIKIVKEKIAVI